MWFSAWVLLALAVVVGAFALGLLWPWTLVPIALVVLGCRIAQRPSARRSMRGLLSGAGAALLYVAWIERTGPGAGALNPFPWLLVGIALLVSGVIAHAQRP